MCGGVYYSINDQDIRVYFPNPKAQLPVKVRSGGISHPRVGTPSPAGRHAAAWRLGSPG